jgi:hypothetical protein
VGAVPAGNLIFILQEGYVGVKCIIYRVRKEVGKLALIVSKETKAKRVPLVEFMYIHPYIGVFYNCLRSRRLTHLTTLCRGNLPIFREALDRSASDTYALTNLVHSGTEFFRSEAILESMLLEKLNTVARVLMKCSYIKGMFDNAIFDIGGIRGKSDI